MSDTLKLFHFLLGFTLHKKMSENSSCFEALQGSSAAGAELPSSISFQPGAEVADGKHPMDLPSGKHTKTYGKSPFFFPTFLCGVLVFDSGSHRLRLLLLLLRRLRLLPPHHIIVTPQLCHTPSFTQLLSHTIFHTHHCQHTTLSHTIFHTHNFVTLALGHMHRGTLRGRRGIWWHPAALCVAGVALGDIHLRFAWASVALVALGWLWWRAWAGIGRRWRRGTLRGRRGTWRYPPSFCVQAWHLATSTFVVRGRRGRRGTWRHLLSFFVALGLVAGDAAALCVAGVALRGRRGTWWQSVALGDIQRHFAWQTWHLWHCARGTWWQSVALGDIQRHFAWQAWHLATSTFVLNGRRGAWWHLLSFSVADVALMALRAWHLVTRRGTWWHPAALCVAGVALGDIHLRFAWQAWHLATSTFVLRGKRHPPSFCVASVALGDIYFRFAWQAWHLWHWASSGGALGLGLVAGDAAALCVAGVALGDIQRKLCVAGVALGDIHQSNERFVLCSHSCKWHALISLHGILGPCALFFCHTASFTHRFVTPLCHTPPFTHNFHTHDLSHKTLSHTPFSLSHTIFHIPLCHAQLFTYNLFYFFDPPPHPLSFLPVPATTFVAHYWKKLTCGVIRSFNFREINYFDWAIFNSYVKLPDCIGFLPSTAGFRKQNHQRRLGQSETNTAIWWKELLGDGWRKTNNI